MDLLEQHQMTREQELNHWWIKTRFAYLDKAVTLSKLSVLNVLEVGCGTAQNLYYCRYHSPHKQKFSHLVGYDPLSVSGYAQLWDHNNDFITNDANKLNHAPFNLILAMDVLEHIDDDLQALKEWVTHLDRDGFVFITVPSFEQLWSQKDVALGHKRRYTRQTLLTLTDQAGLQPVFLNYAFSYLYLPMRLLRHKTFKQKNPYELKPASRWLNSALYYSGLVEKKLGGNPWFGSSLIGLFKLNGSPKKKLSRDCFARRMCT